VQIILPGMRLAALYSGGKDSTFAMYLAEQMGHEITCMVNIIPEDRASWIFHTPNLGVVPLMAESMGLPLITAGSTGTEEGDMAGLREALKDLDVEGVVTGAVWSDYQWDRMNMVCGDLDLKVISPLWRKDQDIVLAELLGSGIRAIIVGCFAEGLDSSWLGRPIDESAAKDLRSLREKYGISIIGEGGEYESMTLDSPMHSRPVEITESEAVWKKDNGTLEVTGAVLGDRKRIRLESSEPERVQYDRDRRQRHRSRG
jgi:diphthine-ammonia ligase